MEEDEKKKSDKKMYEVMTEEQVKKLADDMYKGLIFTDRHIDGQGDISMVFMPLVLMGNELREELLKDPPGMIYEYMDRAGPMSVNGMPIFMSFKMVSIDDTKRVMKYYNKIKCAIENI